jgi:hypothetical protein
VAEDVAGCVDNSTACIRGELHWQRGDAAMCHCHGLLLLLLLFLFLLLLLLLSC